MELKKICPKCGTEMEQGALLDEFAHIIAIDLFCPNCEYQTEWEELQR